MDVSAKKRKPLTNRGQRVKTKYRVEEKQSRVDYRELKKEKNMNEEYWGWVVVTITLEHLTERYKRGWVRRRKKTKYKKNFAALLWVLLLRYGNNLY